MSNRRLPNWACWFLIVAAVSSLGVNAFVPVSQTIYFDTGPAAAERLIWMATWNAAVSHSDEDSGVLCGDEAANWESQCTQSLNLKELLSSDASSALLRIKAKAWNLASTEPSYCLIYARASGTEAHFSNHFIHTEEWSGGQAGLDERRRVSYATVSLPADDAAGVTIGKQIDGDCSVEFVVYLEGYTVRRSLLSQMLREISLQLPYDLRVAIRSLLD